MMLFRPLHALVTDGAFTAARCCIAFPKIDLAALERLFRHRALRMLLRERRIDEAVIRTLLGWRHSGFSLHPTTGTVVYHVSSHPHLPAGTQHVARWMLNPPETTPGPADPLRRSADRIHGLLLDSAEGIAYPCGCTNTRNPERRAR